MGLSSGVETYSKKVLKDSIGNWEDSVQVIKLLIKFHWCSDIQKNKEKKTASFAFQKKVLITCNFDKF